MVQRRYGRIKFFLFACSPVIVLFSVAELGVRAAITVRPTLMTAGLPGDGRLVVSDADLLWSLRPSHRDRLLGVEVVTNDQELRLPPIEPRRPDEFRILSLGESTTFGSRVEANETYTWHPNPEGHAPSNRGLATFVWERINP